MSPPEEKKSSGPGRDGQTSSTPEKCRIMQACAMTAKTLVSTGRDTCLFIAPYDYRLLGADQTNSVFVSNAPTASDHSNDVGLRGWRHITGAAFNRILTV